ncbi:MAG: hypothetical protein ACFUZC_23575 [Chthoniobacteraceae bacterium]
MKTVSILLLLAAFPTGILPAQEKPALDYNSIRLESLPRDARGYLKPEIWDIVEAEAKIHPTANEARAIESRPIYQGYYATYAHWTPPEQPKVKEGRLRNLSETPKEPRFPLTDKVWPERPGDASVCLWEGDKLAAMSLSIDDNCAADIPYWKELSKKYGGLNLTWNIITANVDGAIDKPRGPMSGTWDTWRNLFAEGFHITSHSVTHLGDPVPADGWPGAEWEAAESIRHIDSHLPGHKTTMFVYPGAGVRVFGILGAYYPNSTWRADIVKHYASARGGGGQPINEANQIDYFNIHSTTSILGILESADPKNAPYNLNNLFAADPASPFHRYYRGWASVFIHYINAGKAFDTAPYTVAYGKVLAFYNDHRADLWTGFLDDVALYGQERDTASLQTTEASEARISFNLTTKMDPDIFSYPLTVKVRLPGSWKSATALQNGQPLPVETILNNGAPYALVKAVPDRGLVTLTRAAQ